MSPSERFFKAFAFYLGVFPFLLFFNWRLFVLCVSAVWWVRPNVEGYCKWFVYFRPGHRQWPCGICLAQDPGDGVAAGRRQGARGPCFAEGSIGMWETRKDCEMFWGSLTITLYNVRIWAVFGTGLTLIFNSALSQHFVAICLV